jgi:membrane-bound serine protease (ClpP class)
MRKEFRATAEQRNRPPLIAEAMVDADVDIPDIIEKSKLLTLTTKEALQVHIADFQANSLEAVLQSLNLADAEIYRLSETWAESLVRFLTHPVVSSLLMTVGILGIMVEMRVPGFGLPGAIGLISLSLFFWGHALVQLAGLEEFLLVGLGLILVGAEIFVIPGFGIAGILGIMALMGGLGLSLIGTGATWDFMLSALGQVALSILVAILATLILLRYFPRLPFGKRLILETNLQAQEGYESSPAGDHRWLGKQGIAVSDLHPSGIARFDGERVDVVSDGTFIDAGQSLEVVRIDGNRVVVQLATPPSEKDIV